MLVQSWSRLLQRIVALLLGFDLLETIWVGEASIPGGNGPARRDRYSLYGGAGGGTQILVSNQYVYTNVQWAHLQSIIAG
jgi:hypothetical protein